MIPVRIRVSMPLARSIRSRSVPAKALTRCLVTMISSASGATAGWIFAFSAPVANAPEALRLLNVAFSIADLWIAGTEADDHIDHPHPCCARDGDQLRRPIEQCLRVGGIVVDDQRLEIHDEQHARPAIDRKIVCHCCSCCYAARGVTGYASITKICQVA